MIKIANAIESLEAQILWLQPKLDECCLDIEPELQAIIDGGDVSGEMNLAQVGQTEELNREKLESLFAMEGEEGEDLDTFIARIATELQSLIQSGEVPLVDTGVRVPSVSSLCPESTTDLLLEAQMFAANLALQQTMGPWLDARIAQTCDDNAQAVADLLVEQTEVRNSALVETNTLLNFGFTILGEEDQDLQDFSEALRDEFAASTTAVQASGLPAFTEDCDDEDDDQLEMLTTTIEQALSFEAFNAWLDEKFTEACQVEEMAIVDLVDADAYDELEAAQEQMVGEWFALCTDCEEDETLEEFIRRQGRAFLDSDPETIEADFEVPDYSDDCVEFDESIETTHAMTLSYKRALEAVQTFQAWMEPQFNVLLAAAFEEAKMALEAQTMMLEMEITMETAISDPLFEDFLFVLDPEAEGKTLDEYKNEVVT